MFYEVAEGEVTLRIKAQPAASKNEFSGIYSDNALKVRIKAPAVEGTANKELAKFLAKSFKVPKSAVRFKSGQNSKIKRVVFPLTEQFQVFAEKLLG
ncbi:MAG TPA: YggU family protein [Epsilonproteobacteria bacterium]|nr:YggU family protein [Campylobacterota bacterium]HHH37744.1 YggU family protein [Campylobacterota bacterium]